MTRAEKGTMSTLAAAIGLLWTGLCLGAAAQRTPGHPKPRASVTLSVGDQVTIGGQLYFVGYSLYPAPAPIPSPVPPVPLPTPTPAPTPSPGPAPLVYGMRNARRDWANVFSPGQTILIEGVHFGSAPGTVQINGQGVPVQSWSDNEIVIVCPNTQQFGAQPLLVTTAGGQSYTLTSGLVILPPPGKGDRAPGKRPSARETGRRLPGAP